MGSVGTNRGDQTITVSGDAAGTSTGSPSTALALVLATVNSTTTTLGTASKVAQITANAKGLVTSVVEVAIAIASAAITDLATAIVTVANAQTITGQKTFSNDNNFFGSSTAGGQAYLGHGATTSGATKAVRVGTGGVSGSTTNTEIGSGVTGALGIITFNQARKSRQVTVANLPAAATVGAGACMAVSDSTLAYTSANIGTTVTGAGGNVCPVYSDGTNWRIGAF